MGERKVLNKVRHHVRLRITACSCPCVGAPCKATAGMFQEPDWGAPVNAPISVLTIAVLPAGLRSGEAAPGAAWQQGCADEGRFAPRMHRRTFV